jgi:transcriptional regulator with XRE-family HTH domain
VSKELPDAFGCVLKKYRKRKNWSQMKLAMEAGMHLNALGNLERGKHGPSLQTIFVLSKALGVSIGEFMTAVDDELNGK